MWKLASAATSKRLTSLSSNNNLLYGLNINSNNDKKKEKSTTSTNTVATNQTKSSTTNATTPKLTIKNYDNNKRVLLNKLLLSSKKSTRNDDITLVGVNNRDINHMTRLLANSGISVSKVNNKLLSLQFDNQNNNLNEEGFNSSGGDNNTINNNNNNSINNNNDVFNDNNKDNIKNTLSSSSSSSISESIDTVSSSSSSSSSLTSTCTKTVSSNSSSSSYSENKINSRFNNEFNEFRVLGKGGFGIVFKCTNIYDGMEYAVKRIKVNQRIPTKELMEVRAMARLNHPNIVRYFNSWIEEEPTNKYSIDHYGESNNFLFENQDEDNTLTSEITSSPSSLIVTNENSSSIAYITNNQNKTFNSTITESSDYTSYSLNENSKKFSLYIQMEFCKYGSLRNLLNENNNINSTMNNNGNNNSNNGFFTNIGLDLNKCREVLRQILIGLKYIHNQGIVHRDLTPDNIFICQSPFTIKIADFGLATTTESLISNNNKKGLGTYLYSSNEQEQGESYDQRTDLYSAAVIFFEMLSQFKTTMERSTTLTKLKKTLSVSLTNPQLSSLYPNDSKFIDYLIQPFLQRPHSNQIPIDSYNQFPPTIENLIEFKNQILEQQDKQQFEQFSYC